MNRKLIYIFSLVGFFLMWGMFGFAAAGPRNEPNLQPTIPPAVPDGTASQGIPVL